MYESTIERKYGGCGYSCGFNSERSAVRSGQSEWFISFLLQSVSVDLLSNKASQQGHTASRPTKNETENTAKKWNTHRADSHFHIMGSVMDKGGLEIISSIFQWWNSPLSLYLCFPGTCLTLSLPSFSPQSSLALPLFNSPHTYFCSCWKNQVVPA